MLLDPRLWTTPRHLKTVGLSLCTALVLFGSGLEAAAQDLNEDAGDASHAQPRAASEDTSETDAKPSKKIAKLRAKIAELREARGIGERTPGKDRPMGRKGALKGNLDKQPKQGKHADAPKGKKFRRHMLKQHVLPRMQESRSGQHDRPKLKGKQHSQGKPHGKQASKGRKGQRPQSRGAQRKLPALRGAPR